LIIEQIKKLQIELDFRRRQRTIRNRKIANQRDINTQLVQQRLQTERIADKADGGGSGIPVEDTDWPINGHINGVQTVEI